MKLDVRLTSALLADDELFSRIARCLAEAAIISNRALIRSRKAAGKPLPAVYQAGIVWKKPPDSEDMVDIPTILRRGWGHCLHVSCWRAAELREQGINATIHITRQRLGADKKGRLFHVLLRLPGGKTECPSKILGM